MAFFIFLGGKEKAKLPDGQGGEGNLKRKQIRKFSYKYNLDNRLLYKYDNMI